jgi:hypothetical protein
MTCKIVGYFLATLLLLGLNSSLRAEEQTSPIQKTVSGLGEVCDPKLGSACKSGLECNTSEPGKAGVCANATVPEITPSHPQ